MPRKAPSDAAARRTCAPIFAALGDRTRLALVSKLSAGTPCSITQLTEGTELTRQAVTKHLRVLTHARIVRSVRSGRETLFELDARPLRSVCNYTDGVSARWNAAISRGKTASRRSEKRSRSTRT